MYFKINLFSMRTFKQIIYVIYNTEGWEGKIEIQVYSLDGRLVLDDVWEDQLSYLLDLSNVAAGVYVVRMIADDVEFVRKVVNCEL